MRRRAQGLEQPPGDGGDSDDPATLVTVQQHAAGYLHQGVGPEEGAQQQAFHRRRDIELERDQRHRHRQRSTVDVVDGREQQHEQEYAPTHVGGAEVVHRLQGNRFGSLHDSSHSCDCRVEQGHASPLVRGCQSSAKGESRSGRNNLLIHKNGRA
ncbi:hypothetical protein D9M68_647410 [compost metagenome]